MKYIIRFISSENSILSEWVDANSETEAIDIIRAENTDVKQVLSIIEV